MKENISQVTVPVSVYLQTLDRQCEFVNTGRGIRLQKSNGGNNTVSKLLEEIKLQHRLIPPETIDLRESVGQGLNTT